MRTTEIVLPARGEPETLRVSSRTLSAPGCGQAIVRVEASGVSFAEQQMRLGKYYDQPAFPFVPGYDVVGVIEALGPEPVDGLAVGDRVAALTKTGGWSERLLLDGRRLAHVPAGVEPAAAETVVVNGLTAWRMLHRTARVQPGQTILVLGAGCGVGGTLLQLAREAGIRTIGTCGRSQFATLRALGAEPVDYHGDVAADVRALAPEGVAAVFDHVGGEGITDSWGLLAPRGVLVSYGTASTKDDPGNPRLPVLKLLARLTWWNLAPNGKRTSFFNLWAGRRRADRYWAGVREDLGRVFALLAEGRIEAQIAATFPLERAAEALRLAETRGTTGKVLLVP